MKGKLYELMEKKLTKDQQHGARKTVKRGFHKTVQVIQLDVNLRKTSRNNYPALKKNYEKVKVIYCLLINSYRLP